MLRSKCAVCGRICGENKEYRSRRQRQRQASSTA
jgi:hypothetical protein